MNNNKDRESPEFLKAVSDYCSFLDELLVVNKNVTSDAPLGDLLPTVTQERCTHLRKMSFEMQCIDDDDEQHNVEPSKGKARIDFILFSHIKDPIHTLAKATPLNLEQEDALFRVLRDACHIVVQQFCSNNFYTLPFYSMPSSKQSQWDLVVAALDLLSHAFTQLEYPFLFRLLQLRFSTHCCCSRETKKDDNTHVAYEYRRRQRWCFTEWALNQDNPINIESLRDNMDTWINNSGPMNIGLVDVLILILVLWNPLDNKPPINQSFNNKEPTLHTSAWYKRVMTILVHAMHCGEFLQRYCTFTFNHIPKCEIDSCLGRGLGGIITVQDTCIFQALEILVHRSMDTTRDLLDDTKIPVGSDVSVHDHLFTKTSHVLLLIEFLSIVLRVGLMEYASQPKEFHDSALNLVSSLSSYIQPTCLLDIVPTSWTLEQQGIPLACLSLSVLVHWRMNKTLSCEIFQGGYYQALFQFGNEHDLSDPRKQPIFLLSVSLLVSLCMTQSDSLINFCISNSSVLSRMITCFIESLHDSPQNHSIEKCSKLLLALHFQDLLGVLYRKHLLCLLQDDSKNKAFVEALVTYCAQVRISLVSDAIAVILL